MLDQNLYYLGDKNQSLLYCSAAVVVVYDPKEHTQRHFLGELKRATCFDC